MPAVANTLTKVSVVDSPSRRPSTCCASAAWDGPGCHATTNGPAAALPLFSTVTSIVDGEPANAGWLSILLILRLASGASTTFSSLAVAEGPEPPGPLARTVVVTDPVSVYTNSS